MGHAYTPGLKVKPEITAVKERRLPLKGDILVKEGDKVKSDQVVARTELPGNPVPLNVVNVLSISPEELHDIMLKKEGDEVEKGEMIAESRGLFGFFRTPVHSPVTGTIENVSNVTGQVIFRQAPIPVELKAYIDGVIDEVIPEEGVILGCKAAFIQGIFGIGGETEGLLSVAVKSISEELTADKIDSSMKGKVIVGGSKVNTEALNKAIKVGASGIIAGGIDAADLREFLGYDIGVAITGHEEKGITLVITEGFGKINMAEKTFELLKENEGKKASINGTTQIRAGVMRPEIIITHSVPDSIDGYRENTEEKEETGGMEPGEKVRIIRDPGFGEIVAVKSLPVDLTKVESETRVRVVEIEDDGKARLVPRANVEIIEK